VAFAIAVALPCGPMPIFVMCVVLNGAKIKHLSVYNFAYFTADQPEK
jgi:hypothetical protein